MKALVAASATLGLLACSGPSAPRTILEEESVSFTELSDYDIEHEIGAAVLTSDNAKKKRSSIIIRSVRYDERHDRTPEAMLEATGLALAAMPNAEVSDATPVDHSEYTAMRFDVTFRPHKKRNSYQRTHVVLFAEDHVYHVLHTAPKGHLADAAKDFNRVVASLEEEI